MLNAGGNKAGVWTFTYKFHKANFFSHFWTQLEHKRRKAPQEKIIDQRKSKHAQIKVSQTIIFLPQNMSKKNTN